MAAGILPFSVGSRRQRLQKATLVGSFFVVVPPFECYPKAFLWGTFAKGSRLQLWLMTSLFGDLSGAFLGLSWAAPLAEAPPLEDNSC